ncbi:DUF3958 family protein [Enterococcus sp. BWB1-3]|uniref:DUF3958 family protein n=1 Tax=unclassified Enterococcus TaxID=2608891 RepID=UPI001924C499|nr:MULTISPECIES: DUF3958 family protein [unclassified Enterococcus]MBL1227793.1 DUF3958 family protein [Enterococcus sp. BWB1-3]MCB5952019.1 DUF3958 family protein [Enterococcus sp. BWT-B8]MCB5954571.1 DUF3958 family protein [Enterococcus sp. CWB-B31]
MEDKQKITELLKLKQEEDFVATQHYKVARSKKEIADIQKSYGDQFSHSDQLFEQLTKMFQNSRSKRVFDELFIEAKNEQECLCRRTEAEKEILDVKGEELEARENQLYYEISRLSAELEAEYGE